MLQVSDVPADQDPDLAVDVAVGVAVGDAKSWRVGDAKSQHSSRPYLANDPSNGSTQMR